METEQSQTADVSISQPIETQHTSLEGALSGADNSTADDSSEFIRTLPQEYQQKPYMKDVDSLEKLLLKLDGSQQLIGRRKEELVPKDGATPEQIRDFQKFLGLPESPDKYDFGKDASENPLSESLRKVFHEKGLSNDQAKAINDVILNGIESHNSEQEKTFSELADKHFGDRKDAVLSSTKDMLKKHTPEGFEDRIAGLDNETLLLFSGVIDSMVKAYVGEDKIRQGSFSTANPGELRDEMMKIMNKPEFDNEFHRDHKKLRDQVRRIAQEIAQLEAVSNG